MDIFKKYYEQKSVDYRINSVRRRKVLELIGRISDKKVLDMGCATGYLGQEIKEMGNQVIGVDISEKAVKKAKKVLDEALVLDIQNDYFPFPENHFDIVIMGELIEHLLFPEKAIRQAKKVLKSDGFVIITTPNFLVLPNRFKMLFGYFEYAGNGSNRGHDKGHIHFFTYRGLINFLKKEQLKITEENHLVYFRVPEFFVHISSNLFAYQVIVKCRKM